MGSQTFKLACRRAEANAQLLKTNTQLQMENASLQQQNSELQARLSPLCTLPPIPPSLSPAPHQPPALTLPCPPCSRLLRQQISLVSLSSRNKARARCHGPARTPGCRRKT